MTLNEEVIETEQLVIFLQFVVLNEAELGRLHADDCPVLDDKVGKDYHLHVRDYHRYLEE